MLSSEGWRMLHTPLSFIRFIFLLSLMDNISDNISAKTSSKTLDGGIGNSFKKTERLNSQLVIDKLFAGGNASIAVFPLRAVFMKTTLADNGQSGELPPVSILISVPKKRFRHAVDRNRMKRLVREAYRTQKHVLWRALDGKDYRLAVAFVCITDSMPSFFHVRKSMMKILTRIAEKMGDAANNGISSPEVRP